LIHQFFVIQRFHSVIKFQRLIKFYNPIFKYIIIPEYFDNINYNKEIFLFPELINNLKLNEFRKYIIRFESHNLLRLNLNNYDKIMLLKIITNNNKKYYQGICNCLLNDPDSQLCIYHLLVPKKVIGKERILIGPKKDGSYVILDDFKNIKFAYSFGIRREIQFDKNLADRGIDIYMYDHTINSLPYNNDKFHWKKIGITGKNKSNNKLLKNLEELIIENGHSSEENMILKMDVEHHEWESLIDIPSKILGKFKYILIEYHFRDERIINETLLYYNVIKKIQETHQVFYLRCHNQYLIVNFGNNRFCKYLEVSYIIKKDYEFTYDQTIYPIKEFDLFDYSKFAQKNLEMNLNILKLFDKNN
jgi:hypothetical protein